MSGKLKASYKFWQKTKIATVATLASPEKTFLIIASIAGFLMVFMMPLFMVPDESVHFYRAYQVGDGHFVSQPAQDSTGGVVPVLPNINNYANNRTIYISRSQDLTNLHTVKQAQSFPGSAMYSPVAYIPQAIGIDIGRMFSSSANVLAILGRIANLAAYIALIYLAIRIARQGKWVYAVVGLFPTAIQQAASLSTDVMTIGLSLVTIAFLHSLFMQENTITKKQILYIALLAAGLGLTKQPNVLLLLPVLFLPKRLFGNWTKRSIFVIASLGFSILVAVAWYAITKWEHYDFGYIKTIGIGNVDQAMQLSWVIHHPIGFVRVLFKTYVFWGFNQGSNIPDNLLISAYGWFSWLTYRLPIPFIFLGYMSLVIVLLHSASDRIKRVVLSRLVWVQTGVLIIAITGIAGALYLGWTPIGYSQVSGLQGRYFIPLIPLSIPLFALLGKWIKVSFKKPWHAGLMVSVVAAINLGGMLVLTYGYF